MNTYEKCKAIRRVLLLIVAETMAYDNWSDDFVAQRIKKFPEEFKENNPEFFDIQPADLTRSEMEDLDFGIFSEGDVTMLIPLWLFPFLAEDITTLSISGPAKLSKSEMDNDHRFGYLAYGVAPKDET